MTQIMFETISGNTVTDDDLHDIAAHGAEGDCEVTRWALSCEDIPKDCRRNDDSAVYELFR